MRSKARLFIFRTLGTTCLFIVLFIAPIGQARYLESRALKLSGTPSPTPTATPTPLAGPLLSRLKNQVYFFSGGAGGRP